MNYKNKIYAKLNKTSADAFKKGDMVVLVNDVKDAKAGSKGLIQWVGSNNYMVIISPTGEYSVSKAGAKYIKDGVKAYAKPDDLKTTHMENSWKPRSQYRQEETEDTGDWDDQGPNESWEQFKERMRKAGRDVGD